jgi:HNH endonuclease
MHRLNVGQTQFEECIRDHMFAIDVPPKTNPLKPGELLLLQLNVTDARRQHKLDQRIEYALVFDRLEPDPEGIISRTHWPKAPKTWKYILYGLDVVPTIPFSLEGLGLVKYSGQTNPRYIFKEDEEIILPFIQATVDEDLKFGETKILLAKPNLPTRKAVISKAIHQLAPEETLEIIKRMDQVSLARSSKKRTVSQVQFNRNKALADWIKTLYENRCQLCGKSGKDLEEKYGKIVDVSYSFVEAHHIQYLRDGGEDISSNLVVLCPDHHTIIHATNAHFDHENLTYVYPTGLKEKLIVNYHL